MIDERYARGSFPKRSITWVEGVNEKGNRVMKPELNTAEEQICVMLEKDIGPANEEQNKIRQAKPRKYRRAALVRAEKYQAHYFQYTSLGFFAWIMPLKMLRGYIEKRFFEQPEKQQRAFERMTIQNRNRRERMIKKVVSTK